ncbi:MAG: aldehyde dehydrogenase family protein [Steroidobacteraceae bacterium]
MSDYHLLIGGERIATRELFPVINPSTGERVGLAPSATPEQVNTAVRAASKAFPAWRARADEDRRAVCHEMAGRIRAKAEDLARLLTLEQGKPLNGFGSRFEVGAAEAWIRQTADLDLPVEVVQNDARARVEIQRRPVGVVASITPWNWPLMIAAWHVAPAIRTGNTVVIKPSPLTPLSTLRMIECMAEGLPPGVLNVVTGPDSIAPQLTTHADVAKVIFTGSIDTGRRVMAAGAATLKRLTLELGGNDAAIVLEDADPEAIAEGLFWGAFINSGQTCAALKRLYVADGIYDSVCEALVSVAGKVKMGDGLDEASRLGPVQNRAQFHKVASLVEEARLAGAGVLIGGNPPSEQAGNFYPVSLISEATAGMRIVDEEQFGPALPLLRYRDVDDAISQANATRFGLGGSIWSADPDRAWGLASRLECGTAWINRHGGVRPDVPFGGIKCSGIGVEFGRQGLEEYTTIQVLSR